jgi:hypothetical protein
MSSVRKTSQLGIPGWGIEGKVAAHKKFSVAWQGVEYLGTVQPTTQAVLLTCEAHPGELGLTMRMTRSIVR